MTNSALPYQAKPNEEVHEFTNEFGERWACVCCKSTGDSFLLGDEVGWTTDEAVPLINGRPVDLMLNSAEMDWLNSCWRQFIAARN